MKTDPLPDDKNDEPYINIVNVEMSGVRNPLSPHDPAHMRIVIDYHMRQDELIQLPVLFRKLADKLEGK